jgi:hypothetical protein
MAVRRVSTADPSQIERCRDLEEETKRANEKDGPTWCLSGARVELRGFFK